MKTYLLFAAAAAALAGPAAAQDGPGGLAAGDLFVRVRLIDVLPSDKSSGIEPAFPSERTKVNSAITPEVDFNAMLTDAIGLELIAATTRHTASGRTGTTGAIGDLVSTRVLPPTLLVNYHFNARGAVRPYVGAGLNYTLFYDEKASDELRAAVGPTRVSLGDSFGPAVQAGIDIDLSKRIFLNADVKWIDMDTTARLDTTAAGRQTVRLNLDPVVVGVGVGFRL